MQDLGGKHNARDGYADPERRAHALRRGVLAAPIQNRCGTAKIDRRAGNFLASVLAMAVLQDDLADDLA